MVTHRYYKIYTYFTFLLITLILLSGCNAFRKSESSSMPNYKELKQMVVDILQTEDGKKAVAEALNDQETKKKMTLNTNDVQKIIQNEVLSPENKAKLKKMYEDPKFASELGKTLKKENEKILKDLMKDPDYRKMVIETMKDPEFEKMIMDVMKSNAYRRQMMLVIKDSLESPMFQDDLLKLMEKANEEALKPEKEKGKKKEDTGKTGEEQSQ
ncbi:spore germination lipoprotein GerD [Tepidibacillus decaturensis]|uniref:Spore germination GerD central core domain-containing protein n=1 Tax=Tepidibacillus decaturensis TaxID=1413211 RepID=A0A135L7I4_9BACI|nr:spore germination lipoprotein GerD [Tepidibacillus decaturensis]KXG44936.1 hypothetical protein U473_13590 [Tepidibacillus decaturensis]